MYNLLENNIPLEKKCCSEALFKTGIYFMHNDTL